MPETEYDPRYILSSLNHALKILETLMVRENLGVSEISKITGINISSTFKILYTLEYRGFVRKDARNNYFLGGKLNSYAPIVSDRQNLIDISRGGMTNLYANIHQAVLLCILSANGKVVILNAKGANKDSSIHVRTGGELPWHTNSAGKILMAYQSEEFQEDTLRKYPPERKTDMTITDLTALRNMLRNLHSSSIARSWHENNRLHADIASPIFDQTGKCIAALEIVLEGDPSEEKIQYLTQQLRNSTVQLSISMGYKGYLGL